MTWETESRKAYMRRLYHKRRKECLKRLGGKCIKCGSKDGLEFDHIDRLSKKYNMTDVFRGSQRLIDEELKKIQLLCRKCHTYKTIDDLGRQHGREIHGTLTSYRYCRCDLCKKAKSDNQREYDIRTGRRKRIPRVPPQHGSVVMYGYHKCRCQVCREHQATRIRLYRLKKLKIIGV